MVALGGVVINHVEDHLHPLFVEVLDHLLELLHLLPALAPVRVLVMGCKIPDGVITPVIAQALIDQVLVVDELVHGKKLHGRDAQLLQVGEHRRMAQPGVRATHVLGYVRVLYGQALHVRLVHDGVLPRQSQRLVPVPLEKGVDYDRFRNERRAVLFIGGSLRLVEAIREDGLIPFDPSFYRFRVRIEEEFRRVAPQALLRRPRTVDPEPVSPPRLDPRQVAMPAERRRFREIHACFLSRVVEQAQFHTLGDLGKKREIGSRPIIGGAEGICPARPDVK